MVCLVTHEYVQSYWCLAEVVSAQALSLLVIPLAINSYTEHPLLETIQSLDYTTEGGRAQLLAELREMDSGVDTLTGYDLVNIYTFAGKCLDVTGGSPSDEVPIIQYRHHGAVNQRFRIRNVGDGWVAIHTFAGKSLDVTGGSPSDEVPIIQYRRHDRDSQKFRIESLDSSHETSPMPTTEPAN